MRKAYLDHIRWMTVVLVVIYHVFYMFNAVGVFGGVGSFSDVQYQDGILYVVYPWFMLLLFVVSGMSTRFYLNTHSAKELLRSRTTKLLVPSTIGLFVFWWILGYFNIKMGGGLAEVAQAPLPIRYFIMAFSGTGPLWFIQMLWMFCAGLVLIKKIVRNRNTAGFHELCSKTPVIVLIAFVVLIWGAAQLFNMPVITTYRFGIYGVGFLLGYLVFAHEEVMERLEKWWLPLTLAMVVLCAAFTISFFGRPYAEHEVLDTFLCNAYAWIGVLAILAFMKKWGDFSNPFTEWMTKKSWGLYLFHDFTLVICANLIFECAIPTLLKYLITAIAAFGGAFILYEVLSRIPFLKWAVCGLKKR